jgi:transposase
MFFHALKSFRRIATRYEETSGNYLAIVHLACAMHWLKALG